MTTDADVRNEIIGTVRRFVTREVIPHASALEHEDRYPTDMVEQMTPGSVIVDLAGVPTRARVWRGVLLSAQWRAGTRSAAASGPCRSRTSSRRRSSTRKRDFR